MGNLPFFANAAMDLIQRGGPIMIPVMLTALSATAAGLGIAIFTLIPLNFFHARLARLQFDLEAAATNVEVLTASPAPVSSLPARS